mgnify:CR=1 FL=1
MLTRRTVLQLGALALLVGESSLAEPRLRIEAAQVKGARQRATCVRSSIDEPRRHELERVDATLLSNRHGLAVTCRLRVDAEQARDRSGRGDVEKTQRLDLCGDRTDLRGVRAGVRVELSGRALGRAD